MAWIVIANVHVRMPLSRSTSLRDIHSIIAVAARAQVWAMNRVWRFTESLGGPTAKPGFSVDDAPCAWVHGVQFSTIHAAEWALHGEAHRPGSTDRSPGHGT